jgi:hypothetical protein
MIDAHSCKKQTIWFARRSDVFRLARGLYDKGIIKVFEVVGDYRLLKKYFFFGGGVGNENGNY